MDTAQSQLDLEAVQKVLDLMYWFFAALGVYIVCTKLLIPLLGSLLFPTPSIQVAVKPGPLSRCLRAENFCVLWTANRCGFAGI